MALLDSFTNRKASTLPYALLLLFAVIVLFFISYSSFQQSQSVRKSTELVSQTQEVINEINMLFSNYSSSESAGIKYLVSQDSTYLSPLINLNNQSNLSLERLRKLTSDNPRQKTLLDTLPKVSGDLFAELKLLDPKIAKQLLSSKILAKKIRSIEKHLDRLHTIKAELIASEYKLLKERKANYQSITTLTPINTLYLTLFALGILMFAYSRVNSDRRKINIGRDFLENILENTDNIVSYILPVRNNSEEIINFKVSYLNKKAKEFVSHITDKPIGKTLSEIQPYADNNDRIALAAKVLNSGKTIEREVNFVIQEEQRWFVSTYAKMQGGVTVTTREITSDKVADLALKDLNSRLASQNKELEITDAFLRNMLQTFQYIVSYFEAVRNDAGEIIDFRIVYTNKKITEFTGRATDDILGELVSKEYPFFFNNGDFELHCLVIETGKSKEVERLYQLELGNFYFCNEISKLGDGITILSQDITQRKDAERELESANERLSLQNMVLNDAELVAGVGSYSYNLTKDKLLYSDNCYRLLEVDPSKVKPTKNLITNLIHPEDRARFKKNVAKTLTEKNDVSNVYKIKTANNTVKTVVMQGHFFEKYGESFMVGVIRDITEEISNELTLRTRNRELERSNLELESFNRVVSHDLQEPLRKIQMFISRFSQVDRDNLSAKGTSYLERIDSSASRMQLLIRNLLSYSKLIEQEESTQKIELNLILEKVLEDLSEVIKEKKADIQITSLPSLYGTVFQFEQLFNNLLSNAIKYSKHNTAPEIKVSGRIVDYHSIEETLHLPKSRYAIISVADNGVGFDPKQSKKIFQLFQRLHQKNAYEGTGLGLAICKKIVENHHGKIMVQSVPGEGTQFDVYLPYRI